MGNSPKRPINDKQQKFINEYLIDRSPKAAAIRAGYSPKTAAQQASDLLNHPHIRAEIDKFTAARRDEVGVSVNQILNGIKLIAEADVREAFYPDGTLKPIHEIPDKVALAMASIESDDIVTPTGRKIGITRKIKFWDKNKALELLGKHMAMFTENIRHSTDDSVLELLALVVSAIRQRVPTHCPHCRHTLAIRDDLSRQFQDYGTKLALVGKTENLLETAG